MAIYPKFIETGEDYRDRHGEPTEYDAGLGNIVVGQLDLTRRLNEALDRLGLAVEGTTDDKLGALADVVRRWAAEGVFNCGPNDPVKMFAELVKRCGKAQQLCDRYLDPETGIGQVARHPNGRWGDECAVKAHEIDGRYLLDISDFTISMAMYVDEFFMTVPCPRCRYVHVAKQSKKAESARR